jgi:hypothetical protein
MTDMLGAETMRTQKLQTPIVVRCNNEDTHGVREHVGEL